MLIDLSEATDAWALCPFGDVLKKCNSVREPIHYYFDDLVGKGVTLNPLPLANQFAADLVHKVVSDGLPCIMLHHDTMLEIPLVLYSHATCSHTGDISENFGPNIFATSYLVVTRSLSYYQYFS